MKQWCMVMSSSICWSQTVLPVPPFFRWMQKRDFQNPSDNWLSNGHKKKHNQNCIFSTALCE